MWNSLVQNQEPTFYDMLSVSTPGTIQFLVFYPRLGVLNCYEKHRSRLMINLSRIGLFVPKLVDLRWKLELIEQVAISNNLNFINKLEKQKLVLTFTIKNNLFQLFSICGSFVHYIFVSQRMYFCGSAEAG